MKVIRLSRYLRLILCWYGLSLATVQAQDDWHLEKDKDQIQVYSRGIPGSKRQELKVECILPGTLNQLVALLTDIANYQNVIYKTKSAYIIKRISESELLYYVSTEVPWPVNDRDMTVRMTFAQDPATRTLNIRAVGVPDLVASKPGTVRIADWLAIWQVKPLANRRMQVTYTARIDPGGEIPAWVNNTTGIMGAYQSFSLIRKSLSLPRYQGKTFAFLTP
jgi:hypothetical protein